MNREKIEKLKLKISPINHVSYGSYDCGWNAAIDAVLALGDDVNQSVREEVVKLISNVANQCAFSSLARCGDYSEPNHSDMKMEAVWAGTLRRALALLDGRDG